MAAGKHDPTKADGANVSRREFIARSVAAGLVAATGQSFAATLDVVESEVTVKTPDGTCDAAFIHPASGAYPGVIIWPDAGAILRQARENHRLLSSCGALIQKVPLPLLRRRQRHWIGHREDDQPLIASGFSRPALPRKTRSRSWRSSMRNGKSTRRRRSAPRATAWVARLSCGQPRPCQSASAPARPSTEAGS